MVVAGGRPVPGSSALYVPLVDDCGDYVAAKIRCGGCQRRLYDLRVGEELADYDFDGYPIYARRMFLERLCPTCGAKCIRSLTVTDGEAIGDDGAWKCRRCSEHERGGYLARIVAPKGRIIVRCPRCREESRLNTPAMYRELRRLTEDYSDVPF